MDTDVVALVDAAAAVRAAWVQSLGEAQYGLLALEFDDQTLMLRCDEDTDEVIVSIDRRDPRCSEPPPSCVAALIGMCVVDAWELWNHRGFCDGFRIRCRSDAQYRTLQVEVAASAMRLVTVE